MSFGGTEGSTNQAYSLDSIQDFLWELGMKSHTIGNHSKQPLIKPRCVMEIAPLRTPLPRWE